MYYLLLDAAQQVAESGGEATTGQGSITQTFIMMGAIIAVMYFLMIRPQNKQKKEHKSML